jgi:hypothetical protein
MTKGKITKGRRAEARASNLFMMRKGKILPAERELMSACAVGQLAIIGEQRPDKRVPGRNLIRASFIRFLALGGDAETSIHEVGIQVCGAWIEGDIDFSHCELTVPIVLLRSSISGNIELTDAITRSIIIDGSCMAGIFADRMHCKGNFAGRNISPVKQVRLISARIDANLEFSGAKLRSNKNTSLLCNNTSIRGDLFINDGFTASCGVSLVGTSIGGDFFAHGANIKNSQGLALNASHMEVRGDAQFCDGCHIEGETRLLRARIGRELNFDGAKLENPNGIALGIDQVRIEDNLRLTNATFKGEVRLLNSQIEGDVYLFGSRFSGQSLLGCDGAEIRSGLFFREILEPPAYVSLSAAHVGTLLDDLQSWSAVGQISIDGFRYDRLGNSAPIDAESRIQWLRKQNPDDLERNFKPQPWEQLSKVLREMGSERDARLVAIEKQNALRAAGKIAKFVIPLHWLFGLIAGYGHRPFRAVGCMALIWISCSLFYAFAETQGVFAPTNSRVYSTIAADSCSPLKGGTWTRCEFLPPEYASFNPFAYSLDLLLPLVGLSQKQDWAPLTQQASKVRPAGDRQVEKVQAPIIRSWPLGLTTRYVTWLEILLGWAISLMLAAIITGLIKKD